MQIISLVYSGFEEKKIVFASQNNSFKSFN